LRDVFLCTGRLYRCDRLPVGCATWSVTLTLRRFTHASVVDPAMHTRLNFSVVPSLVLGTKWLFGFVLMTNSLYKMSLLHYTSLTSHIFSLLHKLYRNARGARVVLAQSFKRAITTLTYLPPLKGQAFNFINC